MIGCFKKKKKRHGVSTGCQIPLEVLKLLGKTKFSKTELLGLFKKYQELKESFPDSDINFLTKFLNSMGVFPNKKVTERIFSMIDTDNSYSIEFKKILIILELMMKGTLQQKTNFIFEFLIHSYSEQYAVYENFIDFFKIQIFEDYEFREKGELFEEAENLTMMCYGFFEKNFTQKIEKNYFVDKLKEEKTLFQLFNFYSYDTKNFSDLKLNQHFTKIITDLERIENEINFLITGSKKKKKSFLRLKIDSLKQSNQDLGSFLNSEQEDDTEIDTNCDKLNNMIKNTNFNKMSENKLKFKSLKNIKDKEKNKDQGKENYNFGYNKQSRIKLEVYNTMSGAESDPDSDPSGISSSESEKEKKKFFKKKLKERTLNNPNTNSNIKQQNLQNSKQKIVKSTSLRFRRTPQNQNLHKISTRLNKLRKEINKEKEEFLKEEKKEIKINRYLNKKEASGNVYIYHKNWTFVLTIMYGIKKTIGIILTDKKFQVNDIDFNIKNTIELEALGTKEFQKVKFTDFAPYVFNTIRMMYGINSESYVQSLGIENISTLARKYSTMNQQSSAGKSGSFFFYTSDQKYMVKTISKSEFDFFLKILSAYFCYLMSNPNSFIVKYFGLHKIECIKNDKTINILYFVVMKNLFQKISKLNFIYDLKGSLYKRITKLENSKEPLKDLNFLENNEKIKLSKKNARKLKNQIQNDVNFLERNNIIDYSLLLGIKYELICNRRGKNNNSYKNIKKKLKPNIITSSDGNVKYCLGIIDTLTSFNFKKKSEFVIKRIFQGKEISCIPPKKYAQRFCSFIFKAIEEA